MFSKAASSVVGTNTFSRMPPLIETIIEIIAIEINGVSVQYDCQNLNQLFTVLIDMQNSVPSMIRRNLLNGNNASSALPNEPDVETQYSISTFLGLFNSVKDLDTSLLGNVRLRLTLAPSSVYSANVEAQATYVLNDIFFSCDIISIDDGVFYQMHSAFLNKGGVYSIPFKNYMAFTNSSSSVSQSCNFSISTQSSDSWLVSLHMDGQLRVPLAFLIIKQKVVHILTV
jgi:hypothetical protein